ncbi:MAG: hypothetical protein HZB56_14905 [Deltaproteobacteria bacterium]|nr:hypothetical protein [Deltaproteobacteria bacterium]
MPYLSKRLPHVVTRADLAWLLAPSYAAALSVDEEEAHERLERALVQPALLEELYRGLSDGLAAAQGARSTEDELMDKVSARVQRRRSRARAAPATAALSAVMVRINLEIGLAPESMRETLSGEKGRALLDRGLRELGGHLARELLRS